MPPRVNAREQDALDITAISFDSFPPMPPGAEDWKPNPDSIPRPGPFRDPRFRREGDEVRLEAIIDSKARIYKLPPDEVQRMKSALIPYHNANAVSTKHLTVHSPTAETQPENRFGTRSPESEGSVSSGSESFYSLSTNTDMRWASPVDGGVETPPRTHVEDKRQLTLNKTKTKALPAWYAPLTKVLEESVGLYRMKQSVGQARRLPAPVRSIQPHLRKKADLGAVSNILSNDPTKTSLHESNKTSSTDQNKTPSNEPHKISPDEPNQITLPKAENQAVDAPTFTTSQAAIPKQDEGSSGIEEYGRYLKLRMIMMMEEDMHLERRLKETDILHMSNPTIEAYMMLLTKMHETWFGDRRKAVA